MQLMRILRNIRAQASLLSGLGLLVLASLHAWAGPAATISQLNGVASVQQADGRAALAYDGMALAEGDTVSTGKEASLMLIFADKSQVALRSGSRLQVKRVRFDEAKPVEDSMVLALIKGGLRTVTGFISKRGNLEAYRMEIATATIGIRGTDFTARICEKDCQEEQNHKRRIEPLPSGAIGRIAHLQGELKVVKPDRALPLQLEYPVFEGDLLQMGDAGFAVVMLTDGTRLLMQRKASLRLAQYRFDQNRPDSSGMAVEILKGAARVATGMLAKIRPLSVKYQTHTATIGIRGTSFDIVCGRQEQDPCDGEVIVDMREGRTAVSSGQNELEIGPGQTARVAGPGSAPELMAQAPEFVRENALPTPESMPLDFDGLFGLGERETPAGVYSSVNDGVIVLSQNGVEIEIGKGQSGFAPASGAAPQLLNTTPAFLDYDATLGKFPFIPGLCSAP